MWSTLWFSLQPLHLHQNVDDWEETQLHQLHHHLAAVTGGYNWNTSKHFLLQCWFHQFLQWRITYKLGLQWLQQLCVYLGWFLDSNWSLSCSKCILQIHLHQICWCTDHWREKCAKFCCDSVLWTFLHPNIFLQFSYKRWYCKYFYERTSLCYEITEFYRPWTKNQVVPEAKNDDLHHCSTFWILHFLDVQLHHELFKEVQNSQISKKSFVNEIPKHHCFVYCFWNHRRSMFKSLHWDQPWILGTCSELQNLVDSSPPTDDHVLCCEKCVDLHFS